MELEATKTASLVHEFYYNKNYSVKVASSHNVSQYCPFTGGGDIHIFRKIAVTAGALLDIEGDGATDQFCQQQTV